ncbi:MAG: DUF420 domain-containing protein [Planctomycetota bacterium]
MGPFGTRADLVVDLFLTVLVLLLPVVFLAVALVRRGRVRAHAVLMGTAFVLFLLALVAFELNVRLRGDALPDPSILPFAVHLAFALPTLVLWTLQIARWREASRAPSRHRRRGRGLLPLLAATVATGVWLYLETFT